MTMASSADISAKVDLTTCSICFETFKTPKNFPCLHSFCEGCIKTYITTTFVQAKGGVNCPLCRIYVPKPVDINLEEWSTKLPTNHILVSLIDINESKSGEKLCSACARENETESACSWCMNCAEMLCKTCERSHRRNKYTTTHKLKDVGNLRSSDLKLNHADIRCTEHPDKHLEMFCKDHSAVCCMTCAFLKHRGCKNVGTIQDAAKELKESKEVENIPDTLREMKRSLDSMVQYMGENLQSFDNDIDKIKSTIEVNFTKLSDHLNRLNSHNMSEIAKIEKTVRPKIEKKHDEIRCRISIVENGLALFQSNVEQAPPAQFLQAMEELLEQKILLEKFVNEENQNLQEIRLSFEAKTKLFEIDKDIGMSGKVCMKRTNRKDKVQSKDNLGDMSSVKPLLASEFVNNPSCVSGIALLENGQILQSTIDSETIELRDHQISSVLSSLALPGGPGGIKMTSDTDGAVAILGYGLIFFNILNNEITKLNEIRTSVNNDFVYHQGKYYVGCNQNIAVYDSNHRKIRDILVIHKVGYMAVRDDNSLWYTEYLGGRRELYCITMDGTPLFTYSHAKLRYTLGVTADHAGYIYVCGWGSHNVHQLTHDGKLQRIIFENLPEKPFFVSFKKCREKAVIACDKKVLLYDLMFVNVCHDSELYSYSQC